MGKVFVGHDWAEAHHDVHVEDEEGHRLAKARLPEGVEGVARFHELVEPFVEDPSEVVIATRPTAACSSVRWAPTPVLGRALSRSKIASSLRRYGRHGGWRSGSRRSRPPCAPISWPRPMS